jgi:hypothetical protein
MSGLPLTADVLAVVALFGCGPTSRYFRRGVASYDEQQIVAPNFTPIASGEPVSLHPSAINSRSPQTDHSHVRDLQRFFSGSMTASNDADQPHAALSIRRGGGLSLDTLTLPVSSVQEKYSPCVGQ